MFNKFKYINSLLKRELAKQNSFRIIVPEGSKVRDKEYMIKVDRRISSLIICSLAYTIRSMWFYRVEETDIWEYFKRDDFEKTYNDLRYLMLYLDCKNESMYKDYNNFECYTNRKD